MRAGAEDEATVFNLVVKHRRLSLDGDDEVGLVRLDDQLTAIRGDANERAAKEVTQRQQNQQKPRMPFPSLR